MLGAPSKRTLYQHKEGHWQVDRSQSRGRTQGKTSQPYSLSLFTEAARVRVVKSDGGRLSTLGA